MERQRVARGGRVGVAVFGGCIGGWLVGDGERRAGRGGEVVLVDRAWLRCSPTALSLPVEVASIESQAKTLLATLARPVSPPHFSP